VALSNQERAQQLLRHGSRDDHFHQTARPQTSLHAGSHRRMSDWNPIVPNSIQHRNLIQICNVNQNLQQTGPIAAQLLQSFIDLLQHLPNLLLKILLLIGSNLHPASNPGVNNNIRPAPGITVPLNP